MHAVQVLHFISISFLIPDHHIVLFSACTLVEPGCPKCTTSTNCFFKFSGITSLSPAIIQPNRSASSLKTWENCLWPRSFWLSCKHIFSCDSFGSTQFLWGRVFKKNMKLNSAFLSFFSALVSLYNYHLIFLSPMHFLLIYFSSRLLLPGYETVFRNLYFSSCLDLIGFFFQHSSVDNMVWVWSSVLWMGGSSSVVT